MDTNEIKLKIYKEAKKVYLSADRLEVERFKIFYNDVEFQGHGYEIDLENTWIQVWLCALPLEPSEVVITHFKKNPKHPNYFDSFSCEELAKERTTDLDKIYDIVKTMIA